MEKVAAVVLMNKNSDMTVSDLFEAWLENKKATVQPVTYKHYCSKYKLYLEQPLGATKVNDITPDKWREFENSLSTMKGKRGKTLSLPIIRKLLTLYHTVFAYGKKEFGLNDPTGDNYLPEQSLSAESVFDQQEVEQLKAAVKPYNVHHLCIMLCIYTGVTSGEICAIKWGDIDTDRKLLKISCSLVREPGSNGKSVLKLTDARGKGNGKKPSRDVVIPDWINDQFKLIKRMHKDDDPVIVGRNGGVEPNNFVYHYYSEFLNSAGVKYRPFSAARNTFAKNCVESGMSAEELSKLLGESNAEYTRKKYYQNID